MDDDSINGQVILEPEEVQSGDKLYIVYDGLLKNAGADRIFLHYGFDGWKDPQTVEMAPNGASQYSAVIRASADRRIDMCFKDSAEHWDNNNGHNWRCKVK